MSGHEIWLCDDNEIVHSDAGEAFYPAHPGVRLRVVHVLSGEPIEPGTSGRVVLPTDARYRLETTNADTGERGRSFIDRMSTPPAG